MKKIACVFTWFELLGLALWVGGMVTLGVLVAPTVFGELGSETGGGVMSLVFRKFNGGLVYVCIVLIIMGFVGRLFLDRPKNRSRWVEGGLLLVMILIGLYIGAILGPRMQEFRQIKMADPSNTAAVVGFDRGHNISRKLFTLNLVLGAGALFLTSRETLWRRDE